jgi:hypothetical protein
VRGSRTPVGAGGEQAKGETERGKGNTSTPTTVI